MCIKESNPPRLNLDESVTVSKEFLFNVKNSKIDQIKFKLYFYTGASKIHFSMFEEIKDGANLLKTESFAYNSLRSISLDYNKYDTSKYGIVIFDKTNNTHSYIGIGINNEYLHYESHKENLEEVNNMIQFIYDALDHCDTLYNTSPKEIKLQQPKQWYNSETTTSDIKESNVNTKKYNESK